MTFGVRDSAPPIIEDSGLFGAAMKRVADEREHPRGLSDAAPLYALIILAGAIGLIALLVAGLWFAFL
jgi:hypothetical protein